MKPEKTELGPIRTALFVPGNRPDRVDKAVVTAADRVIIDLEDAVAFSQKEETRPVVRDKIIAHKDRRILVRVNALETDFLLGDLQAIVVEELGGLVLPKTENNEYVGEIHRLLADFEKKQGLQTESIGVILLIESARALQNIYQITSAAGEQNREFLVALGAADYTLDLGIEMTKEGTELTYPRSRIPIACRAAGLAPPLDTPFMIDLKDIDALKADAKRAKQLGFQGKLCIHPNQIEPCNTIFSPTRDEILYAEKVIQAFEEAEDKGLAAIQLEGGFIDYPVVERAERILKLAGTITRK